MRTVVLIILLLNAFSISAQFSETDLYPRGYFRNPLNIAMGLSGNFGELRPNHYHMGLDIRTNRVQNLPVFAAADGFISRVKIEPGGFGRAIYIDHPNGYTTVYAHLNNFFPALEKFVKEKQYQLESWSVYLEIPPGTFPVSKGTLIAYSGNTGGSQAPHLHFEIRKTKQDVNLNPLLFGLPLVDNTIPTIQRLAIYDRSRSVYEQYPRFISIKRTGNKFNISPDLLEVNSPFVSFGIGAYDTQTGSTNHNGIFGADVSIDGSTIIGFRMNEISYLNTRGLNAHIDYKTRTNGGPYVQLLTELPGYTNSIYKKATGNGVIDLSDRKSRQVTIEVMDANGNASILGFRVKWNGARPTATPTAGKMFYPLMVDGFESADYEFYLGDRSLYDSVHIPYARSAASIPSAVSALHSIGASYIPLGDPITVRIKPNRDLTEGEKSRTVMQRLSGSNTEVSKVEWNNGWAKSNFIDFGKFQLVVDTEPPLIIPLTDINGVNLSNASRIVFNIKDNLNQFRNFRAELDGKWLRFTNDKGRSFIYNFDERCSRGEHVLSVRVEDEAGNRSIREFKFTR
jgi:murein DD-endopeptidase MepM/ murein hydrolase activator NlpD